MGKAIRASALILLLACSAQAGWMPNDTPAPPPPQSTSAPEEPTANGYMQTGAPSDLMQIALDVLAALPSLF